MTQASQPPRGGGAAYWGSSSEPTEPAPDEGFGAWASWSANRVALVAPPLTPALELPIPLEAPRAAAPAALPGQTAPRRGIAAIPTLAPRSDIEWHFASFWERLGAALIDAVIMTSLGFVLLAIQIPIYLETGRVLLPWVPSLVYWWASNAYGKSFGKDAMGIEIVNAQWRRPGIVAGFVRWFISNLSALVLGLGYLSVFWDRDRRAWHDHAAGVWVVVKGPSEPDYEPLTPR